MTSSCSHQGMDFFPANFILQIHHQDNHHQNPISLTTQNILLPQDFHGSVSSFLGKRSSSMSIIPCAGGEHHHELENNGIINHINGHGDNNNIKNIDDLSEEEDDELDGSSSQLTGGGGGEKKRRLNIEQVRTLEKNFEEQGNKLDPQRKLQLARALGLQPRQIAIWFQNRRARWKTKQLEKDFDLLKSQFDALKSENDSLQSHNHKLHAQILALKNSREVTTESINLNKETEGSSSSNRSENSSDINPIADFSRRNRITPPPIDSHPNTITSATCCRPLFPPPPNSNISLHPPPHHQLLHNNRHQTVKDEGFCNMFNGIDDQTAGLWPWLEQQHFN